MRGKETEWSVYVLFKQHLLYEQIGQALTESIQDWSMYMLITTTVYRPYLQ